MPCERIPSLAFGSSAPVGRAHLCRAAPWLVSLGGLSPLLGRNFEFCGIRNNVWPAAGVGQHTGRFGISERKSQLDSQLVSAGEAADNSLTLASAHTVRLLAAPLLRSLANFVRHQRRCCPTGVKGQASHCASASIPEKAKISRTAASDPGIVLAAYK